MKCGYVGCKNEAKYELKQLAGKKQILPVCEQCAPEWVTNGKGSPFYSVRKLGTQNG